MPPRQLASYRQAMALNDLRGPQGTLGLIQSLRQISLHPGLFDGKGFDPADSARFTAAIEVLDQVHKLGEKVLIFIESLEIQTANQLPLLLQRRYGLSAPPLVINGAVGTAERQKRVDAFQSNDGGFDVMLLSPKAGGVGLTLTAANHVIHLSRWWNPAVEDQCSDRAHRLGQTKDVHIYYPMAIDPEHPDNSFDLKLNELMSRKRELSRSLLMPMEFSKEDYDNLISSLSQSRT
jgi:SNF2 family DNA or RNA helicase